MAVAEDDPEIIRLAQSEGRVNHPRVHNKPVLLLYLVRVGVERDCAAREKGLVIPGPGTTDEHERGGLSWSESSSMVLELAEEIGAHTKEVAH